MRCAICDSDLVIWAHNSGVATHHWGDGDEKDCTCGPQAICPICNAGLLKQFGFVVLDDVCFGYANDTLQ